MCVGGRRQEHDAVEAFVRKARAGSATCSHSRILIELLSSSIIRNHPSTTRKTYFVATVVISGLKNLHLMSL
jgi:hypothetical protein